jgi:hypothetical protein
MTLRSVCDLVDNIPQEARTASPNGIRDSRLRRRRSRERAMADISIQSDAISKDEMNVLSRLLTPSTNAEVASETSSFTGKEVVDLIVALKDVHLDALSVVLGYILARGGTMTINFGGRTYHGLTLEQILELVKKIRQSLPGMKPRG